MASEGNSAIRAAEVVPTMALPVSVVIPTFNRAQKLVRLLDSIKAQAYRPIEVIVVDDGSTDDTESEVVRWARRNLDDSLDLTYTARERSGPSAARNMGIQNATGEYIHFIDSDDFMHSNLLAEAVRVLEQEEADCVLFGFLHESPAGRRCWLPPDLQPLMSFFKNNLWGYTCASLKRMDLVHRTGLWNESISHAEDYEFLGRVLLHSQKTVVLREPLMTVTKEHGDSLGASKDSDAGLKHRLIAEHSLVDEVLKCRGSFPEALLEHYVDRLFKTAVHMHARGKCDFARALGLEAKRLRVRSARPLSRIRRVIWSMGRIPCTFWTNIERLCRPVYKCYLTCDGGQMTDRTSN